MAKPTLLEITQDVLNDLDGDEVNSIDDTTESVQVAAIIRSTYQAMMTNRTWPHTRRQVVPSVSGDNSAPTEVTLGDEIKELILVNYATFPDITQKYDFVEVKYIDPDNFLRMSNSRGVNTNSAIFHDSETYFAYNIVTNRSPEYYTSFDDKKLIFDSFNNLFDDTLQVTRLQMLAYVIPDWDHIDDFVPDLPLEAFPSLIEESKSRASAKLRQQADPASAQESARQRRYMARKDWTVAGGIKFPNYGRGHRGGYSSSSRDPTFRRDN